MKKTRYFWFILPFAMFVTILFVIDISILFSIVELVIVGLLFLGVFIIVKFADEIVEPIFDDLDELGEFLKSRKKKKEDEIDGMMLANHFKTQGCIFKLQLLQVEEKCRNEYNESTEDLEKRRNETQKELSHGIQKKIDILHEIRKL